MEILDISLPLNEGTIVYPGNPSISFETQESDTSKLTKITFGSHSGTHIDGPSHVFEDDKGVNEAFGLNQMIGGARVLDMTDVDKSISVSDLKEKGINRGEKILVKTKNSLRGYNEFREDFIYLSGDGADYLSEKEIELFGIDYLSAKEKGGDDQRPHTSLLGSGILLVEGLDLSGVEPGEYTLVVLPLKMDNLDAVPSRAILIRGKIN